jgi:hypothetical protein
MLVLYASVHSKGKFPAEAVGKLDAVFGSNEKLKKAEIGELRHHSVTEPKKLTDGVAISD